MENIDLRQLKFYYDKTRREAFADKDVVMLHIAEDQTYLVYRRHEEELFPLCTKPLDENNGEEIVDAIPFGYQNASLRFFKHNPPNESEIEMAINNVEDHLMPLVQKIRPLNAQLVTFDAIAREIGTYANAQPTSITIGDVEEIFLRLALIIGGRPSSTDVLPPDNGFIAYELLLREVMHHLGFQTIKPVDF